MKVIVIGAGEVGFHIASKLTSEKNDVVLIEQSREKLAEVADILDAQLVLGSGADPAVLVQAGLNTAKLLVAVTSSDECNILACRLAQLMAPETRRVARIRGDGYYEGLDPKIFKDGLGIDFIINPGQEAVENIIDFLALPGATDVIDVARGRLKLVGVRLSEEHPLARKTLAQSMPRGQGQSVLIAAIYRNHDLVIPRGDTLLLPGDLLYVAATNEDMQKIREFCGLSREPIKDVVIVGGGEVGYLLARRLEAQGGFSIKLIEYDPERATFLSEGLNKTIVLLGDGTDQSLLVEEHVGDCDAFIAVTTDDEKNMISCLLAKRLGANHTITRVNRFSYASLVSAIGLEALVSVRVAAISAVLKYIRRGRVVSVATLKNEDAEIIEFEAANGCKVAGMTMLEAPFPQGAIVAALTRGDIIIIPRGDTVIQPGDILVVVAKGEVIGKVEKLLSAK